MVVDVHQLTAAGEALCRTPLLHNSQCDLDSRKVTCVECIFHVLNETFVLQATLLRQLAGKIAEERKAVKERELSALNAFKVKT